MWLTLNKYGKAAWFKSLLLAIDFDIPPKASYPAWPSGGAFGVAFQTAKKQLSIVAITDAPIWSLVI